MGPILLSTLPVALRSSLPCIARYRLPGNGMKICYPFSPNSAFPTQDTYSETYASSCTSRLSSCTALQQDFVISKEESKHLMMNILAAVHSDQTDAH